MLDALTFDAGSTLTPDYMLMLDSRDITGNISDRLMSMTLTDNRGFEADQLDIELNDADGQVELPVTDVKSKSLFREQIRRCGCKFDVTFFTFCEIRYFFSNIVIHF